MAGAGAGRGGGGASPGQRPVETALEEAFGGPAAVPEGLELRTDHGAHGRGLRGAVRDLAPRAHLRRPTGNAVAERFIQTLKVELLRARDWESIADLHIADLQREVDRWLVLYNHVRPHEALAWNTPAEKRVENLGVTMNRAA